MDPTNLVLAATLLAIPAAASANTEGRLVYEAPSGCPSRSELAAAILSRGADLDAPRATQNHAVMVLSIRRHGGTFQGSFHIRDDRGETHRRDVSASSCNEVADALAVVTAIALNDAGNPESPAPSAVAEPRESAMPPPSSPDDGRLRASTRVFPPRSETIRIAAGNLRFDLQRSATVYAGFSVGAIPSVLLPRYERSLVTANFVTTPEGAQRIAGLVLRLRGGVLGKGTYRSADTSTDAAGLTFGIDLCQSPLYDSRGLVVLLCGGFGGGVMMLETHDLNGRSVQSKNTGIGEASLSGEIQYYIGAGLHAGLRVGGAFTVGQVSAERADGSRVFQSSPWSGYALLGIGGRF